MINIIVAVATNGVIGCDNRLIWHISEDLKRFKRLTLGHPVIMGRKTFESLSRPLPGRANVVVTRDRNLRIEGVTVVNSIEAAIALLPNSEEIFIIGGGEIYAQTIDIADNIYLTLVDQTPQGDTFFPLIDPQKWEIASRELKDGYQFVDYKRIKW